MIYVLQAELCRVLGHPRRLAILDLLGQGERSTAELLAALSASKANLSQHLAVMKHAGLVVSRQRGREALHRLAFPEITQACQLTREVLVARWRQTSRLARTLTNSSLRTFVQPPARHVRHGPGVSGRSADIGGDG